LELWTLSTELYIKCRQYQKINQEHCLPVSGRNNMLPASILRLFKPKKSLNVRPPTQNIQKRSSVTEVALQEYGINRDV